jgi:hypothetical protein
MVAGLEGQADRKQHYKKRGQCVVECLPSKHEALSSNPSTSKKKKKEIKKEKSRVSWFMPVILATWFKASLGK